MFTDLLSKAQKHYQSAQPFVLYRKPMEAKVKGVFQKNGALHHAMDFTETGFVFAPFEGLEKAILLKAEETMECHFDADVLPQEAQLQFKIFDETQKEFHIALVKKGIQAIQEGQFQKVVLSRCLNMAYSGCPFILFINLLKRYASAFCYLFYHPKVGLWLGASPELLLKTENRELKTLSLAGTQNYKGEESPTWGTKELEEQELVTQYISQALQEEVNELTVFKTDSVRAGNLWHLSTEISGILKKQPLKSVITALHPTPAVCGMPKDAAKKFILAHENYKRSYYTGFLGELNFKTNTYRDKNKKNKENQAYRTLKSSSNLYVNLRCMNIEDKKAFIYVGGGITAASIPEKEWEETQAKSQTMLQVF